MRRFNSPESFGAMIYPPQEKKKKNQKHNYTYSTDFQAMLDGIEDEDFTEESSRNGEKKRRLSLDQAKTLEKIFEVDNKLEAEQKVKIAEELGLKPRQIAIWFQNRRARLKTKQLERDYRVLKANYEALKLKFQIAVKEKESFVAEVKELRAKLGEENTESNHSVVAETQHLESEKTFTDHEKYSHSRIYHQPERTNPDYGIPNDANSFEIKDGLFERNCSGFFNEESDLNSQLPMLPPTPSSFRYESSSSMYSSWVNYFQLLESKAKGYQDQFVKVEEQSTLFGTEDFQQYFLT